MKLGLGGNMGIKRQLYSDGNYNSDEDVIANGEEYGDQDNT